MNGALIIDKPAGMTSHDIVARLRRITGERRAGHTGTLDPFATGVLVVLLGRATRLAQFLSGAEKEYEAVIRFGYSTDTGDITGTRVNSEAHVTRKTPQSLSKHEIEAAMTSLTGEIGQIPPMYSAKKVDGRKLYEHARRGETIDRPPVRITIREFQLLSENIDREANEDATADIRVRVVCSAGTYVRTLAEDLGKQLGTGAHLTELRRMRAGRFGLEHSITLEKLADHADNATIENVLISPYNAVSHLPALALDEDDDKRVLNGIDVRIADGPARGWADEQAIRLSVGEDLLAVGLYKAGEGLVHPHVVIKQQNARNES